MKIRRFIRKRRRKAAKKARVNADHITHLERQGFQIIPVSAIHALAVGQGVLRT
jgi:hypothetical protein